MNWFRSEGAPAIRAILSYKVADQLSGGLLAAASCFAPWAFGTSEPWSIWTMNVGGYVLAGLLGIKLFIRRAYGYQPGRWDETDSTRRLVRGLAILTLAILGYTLIAAINARADYRPVSMEFSFRSHLTWLPHSYNRQATWQAFANYLALAGYFYSLRDWLLGKSAREVRLPDAATGQARQFPNRLRWLLWILVLNGTLLAGEAIVQRLDGGSKLLFLVEPRINKDAVNQFGPFAYRANGAQYLNLLWPLGVALWWKLRREARQLRDAAAAAVRWRAQLLLPAIILMAAGPIVSTSRGGAIVTVLELFAVAVLVVTGLRRRHAGVKFASLLFFGAVLATGLYLGWDQLSDRLKTAEGDLAAREDTFATARKIAAEYPWLGTGPGSFEAVFPLYRESTDEYWPAQLHNDWLETLITFGRLGSGLIALAFAGVLARWFGGGGISVNWRFAAFVWVALAGCLLHARFDFPLQVYSILHLFLVQCAILMAVGRRPVST